MGHSLLTLVFGDLKIVGCLEHRFVYWWVYRTQYVHYLRSTCPCVLTPASATCSAISTDETPTAAMAIYCIIGEKPWVYY